MFFIFSAISYAIGIALIIFVIMQKKEPTATLAWIFVIVALPVVGVIFYLWFGHSRIERRVYRRQKSNQEIERQLGNIEHALTEYKIVSENSFDTPVQTELTQVTKGIGGFSVTHGNSFELLTEPHEVFSRIEEAIEEAKDSIHMEYYIFRRDKTGKRIRDLLIKAAKRGVEVRLLTDGVGSWTIGDVFILPLLQAGAKFARYLPVTFLGRPWHWNLRNHRKIAIFDGTLGMIGSINIGDEYRFRTGIEHDFYDAQIICEGPVVKQLQEVFASDWFFSTKENLLESDRYFPLPERIGAETGQIAQSGPDDPRYTLHEMICAAIHAAEHSVKITTPYFVPDQALIVALRTAALRGVKVEIMLARHFPNFYERLFSFAARSYYEDLLSYGIKIYEHTPGFLHAKGITIDSSWGSIGTANMDTRSFQLNFEVNVNFYSKETVKKLDNYFDENINHCKEIDLYKFKKRSLLEQGAENVMRLFSPIL
jgi:cardiolipin synthase A/B